MLRSSVEGIFIRSDMNVSILTVLIVAGTAVTKFILGNVYDKSRKSVESEVLLAVGEDGRNDSYFSGLTILSSVDIFIYRFLAGCLCRYCIFFCRDKERSGHA
mgnify:CR=1 FL=1